MTPNGALRFSAVVFALVISAVVCVVWLVPLTPDAKNPAANLWALKLAGLFIGSFALLVPLDAFNSWVLVNEDGVRRQNLFWQQTFLRWQEIKRIEYRDSGEFWFEASAGRTLVVSLNFNGLEDLQEYAQRHLDGRLATEVRNLLEAG